jgi:thiamine biosynthesis protein ThiS
MRVTLNGESRELTDGITVADLVAQLELTRRRIAIEINRDLVPRDAFDERMLEDGDVIEIVHFIGGG